LQPIEEIPATASIRFEALRKKRICFTFLEWRACREDEKRKAALAAGMEAPSGCKHAHEFTLDDLSNFFRLIRETDDDKLPDMLRMVMYSRKQERLMGIYNQAPRCAATRMKWLEFFIMTIEALVAENKTPNEEKGLIAHLRTLYGTCPFYLVRASAKL
jgi:hypothetical protein